MKFVRYSVWFLALGTTLPGCATEVEPDPVGTATDSLFRFRSRLCAGPHDLECGEGRFCRGLFGLCPSARFYGVC